MGGKKPVSQWIKKTSSHHQRRCLRQICEEKNGFTTGHGGICMLIYLSVSVRHSLRFHEINIHLLLMALMYMLRHKNSNASPPSKSSWDRHMEDTWRHMDKKCRDECKHRLKCIPLIKMYLCLGETVKKAPVHSWTCCLSAEEGVGSRDRLIWVF